MSPHGVDKSVRWYLAGPMTGIKSFNYPYFDLVAARLRADGYDIVSPAEMDFPENRRVIMASPNGDPNTLPAQETWGKLLARDIPVVTDQCGGIIFLPDWWKSRGARLEATCGLLTGKRFGAWGSYCETVQPMTPGGVAAHLRSWLGEFAP